MINNPKLINDIIEQIEKISLEELNMAIEMSDNQISNSIEIKNIVYHSEEKYVFNDTLNTYKNLHKKDKKTILDIIRKKSNKENLEAA